MDIIISDRKYSDFNNFDNMPSPWLNNNMNHNNDMNSSRNNFGGGNIWGNNSGDRGNNGGGGGGGNGGGGGMHCVHMRGLPFKANQMDVADVSFSVRLCFQFSTLFFLVFQTHNTCHNPVTSR